MTILMIIVGAVLATFLRRVIIPWVYIRISGADTPAAIVNKTSKVALSWAAKEIVKLYNTLPEAHRPSLDILSTVRAIDTKYGIEKINSHFQSTWNMNNTPTWNCSCVAGYDGDSECYEDYRGLCADECTCYSKSCQDLPEFATLKDSIMDVRYALAEQERIQAAKDEAVRLAGIESDLASIDLITEALTMEKNVINGVSKELELR